MNERVAVGTCSMKTKIPKQIVGARNGGPRGCWNRRSGDLARLAAILGLAVCGGHSWGATRTWSGAGGTDFWSDGGNWSGGVPVNGDEIVFGQNGGGDSILNFSLSLTAFKFAPAILPVHNFHLAGGASLTLTGFGIDNNSRFVTGGGGVIRQQLYMDGGSTLTFQNTATIGGSAPVFNLPVDLNALGGTTAGGTGGRIIFENNSTASGPPANTFTGLRVYGGTVAGAGGGEMIFRDDARMGSTAAFGIHGGEVAGAQGGTLIFEDRAIASTGSNANLSGTGLGGRVVFRENAAASGSFGLNNYGAGTLEAGNEAVTQFLDDAGLNAFVWNFAGQGIGMQGGRTEFRQRATFGGTTGGAFIINGGSFLGGEGGRTVFYDDTRIVGTSAIISNRAETEGSNPGGIGGVTEFLGNSRAGQATIYNDGASSSAAGSLGGRTFFRENSSAESATITTGGGSKEVGAVGGSVEFSGNSTAANATITAQSGREAESGLGVGLGGRILFSETASGGAASVTAELGGVFDMSALTTAGTTLGSIAGAGEFFLGNKTLTVGSNNTSTVVSGVISDGGQAGGTGASLAKVGTGTLELAGTNTYTGATAVSAGKLLVTGALGNGAVTVAGGATLGGTGTIGGAVAVADGGIIAPGKVGAGTLTVGALTLNSASILDYQIGSLSDRIDVNGPLSLDGTLNLGALPGLTVGVYRLLNYTGAFTDNALALGTVPAGINPNDFSIQTDIAGQVNLVLNGGAGELLFWDGPNFASNGVINGGTASWTNAPTNWTNSGGTLNQAWASQKAVFSGAAGVVTLGENVSTSGLQFATSGYAVSGPAGTALMLTGTAPIRVDAGASATISATITGGALDKTGIGTLTLSGDNSYSGGTAVTDGALIVTNAAGLGLGTGPVTVLPALNAFLRFTGGGSAGSVAITNRGGAPADNGTGFVEFFNSATAGAATISNLGNPAPEGFGAFISFDNSAQAGSAVIENFGAAFANPVVPGFEFTGAARIFFRGSSSAGAATLTNHGGLGNGLFGGQIEFLASSTAGTANVINRGATTAVAYGGATAFSGNATAASATLTVEGGSGGGGGGTIRFTGSATGGTPRVIFLPGGAADGLLDIGTTSFSAIGIGSIEGNGLITLGSKRLEVGGNNLETVFSGVIIGFGGSVRKAGTADLTLAGASSYTGGTVVDAGDLNAGVTGALGTGAVFVNQPGRLFFQNAASAGGLVITNATSPAVVGGGFTIFAGTATAGNASITNRSNTNTTSYGGQLQFIASASAGSATIINEASSVAGFFQGAGSGFVTFFGNASGGNATITNRGGGVAGGTSVAAVNFFENSHAGSATLINEGGVVADSTGGFTAFSEGTSAENATINNLSGQVANARGGFTAFEISTAGNAVILNAGASGAGTLAGGTEFRAGSTAGDATIRNTRATASGAGGMTRFSATANAGTSAITNEGGQNNTGGNGFTEFYETANAGAATFFNGATLAGGTFGGRTRFFGASRAGTATFDNEGSKAPRVGVGQPIEAGETNFRGTSNADGATITNRGKTVALGASGGIAQFLQDTKAGTATILNEGSAFASSPDPAGGWTIFREGASAEQAVITNRAPLAASGGPGETHFDGNVVGQLVTADRAMITNEGGLFAFQPGGQTIFRGIATADAATFINQGGLAANAFGGATFFRDTTTAGTASFTNEGGAANGADGGSVNFLGDSRAEQSTILSEGGQVAGASGGSVSFLNRSNAESATLRGLAGVASASGGRIGFYEMSDGGTARAILEGSGAEAAELSVLVTDAGLGIGSIEGSGNVNLGGKNLAVGSNNLDTLFSGVIRDGVGTPGSLNKVGTGTLELSGANSYTGTTTVLAGVLRVSGSLAGSVNVQGGTLGGNGNINGGVNVGPGGVVNPGASIGAFTTAGLLSFSTGAAYGLEIDSTAGTADSITALNVTIGTGVDLFGLEIGAGTLPLGLQFKIIDNTSPNPVSGFFSDLSEGAAFAVGNNLFEISYHGGDGNDVVLTNVVPEPGSAALAVCGALLLGLRRRGSRRLEAFHFQNCRKHIRQG